MLIAIMSTVLMSTDVSVDVVVGSPDVTHASVSDIGVLQIRLAPSLRAKSGRRLTRSISISSNGAGRETEFCIAARPSAQFVYRVDLTNHQNWERSTWNVSVERDPECD